ncbi:MAG: adenylate/guanylate cyclase domain-containing protein [Solirubrobacterales bacterium]
MSTFMFADLAGFTALTEAHGDEQAADVAADFYRHLTSITQRSSGEAIKEIGDAVMLRCPEAADAVDLGLTIVEAVASRPLSPTVRVGMHTGSAVERDGDWFGSTVNLAARVSGAAAGGEVLLTEETASMAGSIDGITMQRLGARDFRNIADPVVVYRAHRAGAADADQVVDPVCKMAVADCEIVGSLSHQGISYRFCSLACAERFAAAPDRFVRGGASP